MMSDTARGGTRDADAPTSAISAVGVSSDTGIGDCPGHREQRKATRRTTVTSRPSNATQQQHHHQHRESTTAAATTGHYRHRRRRSDRDHHEEAMSTTAREWGTRFWITLLDEDGEVFYANPATGEREFVLVFSSLSSPSYTHSHSHTRMWTGRWNLEPGTMVLPPSPNGEWYELWSEEHGLPYYFHTKSRETRWYRPVAADDHDESSNTTFIIPLRAVQRFSIQLGKRFSLTTSACDDHGVKHDDGGGHEDDDDDDDVESENTSTSKVHASIDKMGNLDGTSTDNDRRMRNVRTTMTTSKRRSIELVPPPPTPPPIDDPPPPPPPPPTVPQSSSSHPSTSADPIPLSDVLEEQRCDHHYYHDDCDEYKIRNSSSCASCDGGRNDDDDDKPLPNLPPSDSFEQLAMTLDCSHGSSATGYSHNHSHGLDHEHYSRSRRTNTIIGANSDISHSGWRGTHPFASPVKEVVVVEEKQQQDRSNEITASSTFIYSDSLDSPSSLCTRNTAPFSPLLAALTKSPSSPSDDKKHGRHRTVTITTTTSNSSSSSGGDSSGSGSSRNKSSSRNRPPRTTTTRDNSAATDKVALLQSIILSASSTSSVSSPPSSPAAAIVAPATPTPSVSSRPKQTSTKQSHSSTNESFHTASPTSPTSALSFTFDHDPRAGLGRTDLQNQTQDYREDDGYGRRELSSSKSSPAGLILQTIDTVSTTTPLSSPTTLDSRPFSHLAIYGTGEDDDRAHSIRHNRSFTSATTINTLDCPISAYEEGRSRGRQIGVSNVAAFTSTPNLSLMNHDTSLASRNRANDVDGISPKEEDQESVVVGGSRHCFPRSPISSRISSTAAAAAAGGGGGVSPSTKFHMRFSPGAGNGSRKVSDGCANANNSNEMEGVLQATSSPKSPGLRSSFWSKSTSTSPSNKGTLGPRGAVATGLASATATPVSGTAAATTTSPISSFAKLLSFGSPIIGNSNHKGDSAGTGNTSGSSENGASDGNSSGTPLNDTPRSHTSPTSLLTSPFSSLRIQSNTRASSTDQHQTQPNKRKDTIPAPLLVNKLPRGVTVGDEDGATPSSSSVLDAYASTYFADRPAESRLFKKHQAVATPKLFTWQAVS